MRFIIDRVLLNTALDHGRAPGAPAPGGRGVPRVIILVEA